MSKTNFSIITDKFGEFERIKLVNTCSDEYISILPQWGGMLLSSALKINNSLIEILDCYGSPEELKEELAGSFKGSNLFPFPNRIDGGKYQANGNQLSLDINFPNENNAIHGLVYNKEFLIVHQEETDNSCKVQLSYSFDGSNTGYPFNYEYFLSYTLNESGITIDNSVKNTGTSQAIPVGFGYHPYFTLGSKVDDIELEFASESTYLVGDRMIPTGETEKFDTFNTAKAIENYEFDTCFGFGDADKVHSTKLISKELNGGMDIWQKGGEQGLKFVQIYTPPHRNSIAIEPMSCIANAFNNKIGLIELEPKASSDVSWGIKKI